MLRVKTKNALDQIKKLLDNGHTKQDVARITNFSRSYIYYLLKLLPKEEKAKYLNPNYGSPRKLSTERIVELMKQGLTYTEIAKKLDSTLASIKSVVNRKNLYKYYWYSNRAKSYLLLVNEDGAKAIFLSFPKEVISNKGDAFYKIIKEAMEKEGMPNAMVFEKDENQQQFKRLNLKLTN